MINWEKLMKDIAVGSKVRILEQPNISGRQYGLTFTVKQITPTDSGRKIYHPEEKEIEGVPLYGYYYTDEVELI